MSHPHKTFQIAFFIIPFHLDLGRFLGRLNLVRWGVVATVGGAVGSATLFANGWLVGYLDAQIGPFEAVAEGGKRDWIEGGHLVFGGNCRHIFQLDIRLGMRY